MSNSDKLKTVMSQVFQIDVAAIHDDANPDNIENWDSVNQLNLVMALEEEFGVALSADDAAEMLSLSLIKSILGEHGVDWS